MNKNDPTEPDINHFYRHEDFEHETEGPTIPREPFNEADYLAPYRSKAHKICQGSMVNVEKHVTEIDIHNDDYLEALENDPTIGKNMRTLWCVGKVFLKNALPWNGKFHKG